MRQPACPAGVPVQRITVKNEAHVRASALAEVERATVDQSLQIRAAWGTPCVWFGPGGWVFTIKPGRPVVNPDGSVTDAATGAHPVVNGQPSAWITTGGLAVQGWARNFTHEAAEMLTDPYDEIPNPGGIGLREIADPVERVTYRLDGLRVTDFAFPSYFNGGAGPYDEMGVLTGGEAS